MQAKDSSPVHPGAGRELESRKVRGEKGRAVVFYSHDVDGECPDRH